MAESTPRARNVTNDARIVDRSYPYITLEKRDRETIDGYGRLNMYLEIISPGKRLKRLCVLSNKRHEIFDTSGVEYRYYEIINSGEIRKLSPNNPTHIVPLLHRP